MPSNQLRPDAAEPHRTGWPPSGTRSRVSATTNSSTGSAIFLLGVATGAVALLLFQELTPAREDPDVAHFRRVRDFVAGSFVREVGRDELLDHALHGMLAGLDGYSRYYDSDEAAALERETGGRYVGVGAVFRRPVTEGRVLFTLPRSPARRAGVEVGERFVTIDGRALREMSEDELRGLLSSERVLTVDSVTLDGKPRSFELEPSSLVDPTVRHARLVDAERGVGYLAIVSFSRETPGEFERTFDHLREQGMRAAVIDLRGNYGGVLDAAVAIAQRFVREGVLVTTEGRGEPEIARARPSLAIYADTPLVLLVDGASASASEVLAGALQDHRAAVVVGSPTYGKGMVQKMQRYAEPSAVAKVTSSYYYTPAHRNFERSAQHDPDAVPGIQPDVAVALDEREQRAVHDFLGRYGPSLDDAAALAAWEAQAGESLVEAPPADPQLDAALALFAGTAPSAFAR